MSSSGSGTPGVNGASEDSDGQQLERATGFPEPRGVRQCVGRQNAQQPTNATYMMNTQNQPSFFMMALRAGGR